MALKMKNMIQCVKTCLRKIIHSRTEKAPLSGLTVKERQLVSLVCSWYEPVMTCLMRVFPNLVVGGSIILDDYHDWGGCRKATDEYLRGVVGQFVLDDSTRSMKITRV